MPFMMQVFQIREDKRALIPAVTHVDGSGRLQTVIARHQSALPPADRELSRRSPACRWCSTRRSTRTSRWCASPRKRSTASCGQMDVLVMGNTIISRAPMRSS